MRDYQTADPAAHQRRPEYQRGDTWIREFLRTSLIAHVGHLSGDQAFVTPTNFWFDEEHHRIVFHSNLAGRLRSNLETSPKICMETSEFGRFLPSNAALEFSIQFRSVVVFGTVRILEDPDEIRHVLYGLLAKYFPHLHPGEQFRPILDNEIARTSVYVLEIESWSGKENWQDQADMVEDWPPLPEGLL
jgi:nitroimidazol reductase NimA-like FMN-containing flavoprotein (pyridoxamine 5'-phosphate oxidase superfamily)